MKGVEPSGNIPEELHEVVRQLRLVFPSGMDEHDDYLPLLVVLDPLLSDEHLGVVVEAAFGIDRHLVRNQAAAALSVKAPAPEVVERLRTRMTAAGWSIVDDE
ncbi:DUF3349 domain-containing protein [Streptomyces sp. NPDC051740]|uniref:DUF3349 domain-containing protein n=1 Tax=Streptomyces sp. NPDC051740 TaxID=3365673 RepID=UPI0037AA6DCD